MRVFMRQSKEVRRERSASRYRMDHIYVVADDLARAWIEEGAAYEANAANEPIIPPPPEPEPEPEPEESTEEDAPWPDLSQAEPEEDSEE